MLLKKVDNFLDKNVFILGDYMITKAVTSQRLLIKKQKQRV